MNTVHRLPERRSHRRSRCLKGARVIMANGKSTLNSLIANETEDGLALTNYQTMLVPMHFTLLHDYDGVTLNCKLVWRRNQRLGARILSRRAGIQHMFNRCQMRTDEATSSTVLRYPL